MALPNPPQNPNTPIPNNPFFAPLNPFVCGPYFPVAVSAGIDMTTGATVPQLVNDVGNVLAAGPGIALNTFLGTTTITATGGGGGSGTVTSITAGTGLTGGIITTSGTIALANTAVTPGAYTAANITVDAQGRITAAANGSGGGIPCSTITGKGALVTGTAASTPVALAVGTDGYVLTACAACTEGLTWVAGSTPATPIVEGIVYGCTDGATSFNTALGYNALLAPTALGIANVAIGTSAGNAVTDGYGNTLIGPGTGCSVTTGTVNTAVGIGALCGVTSGFANLGVGICSGCAYITESGNAVFGGYYGDSGDTNSLILSDGAGNLKAKFDNLGALSFDGTSYGAAGEVLSSNGPGAKPTWIAGGGAVVSATPTVEGIVYGCTDCTNFNYGLGDNIFGALTTGTLNIAIGTGALATTDTGTSNTAVGIGALFGNTTGIQNVALGQQTLFTSTTAGLNTAVGSQALQNTTGDANTALGNFAGNVLTTGCGNILIGNGAGGAGAGALDTGCDNVVIGNCVSVATNSGNCQLAIGTTTFCWLSGTSTGAIKPGAGIIDCAASTGTAGQVLMSNGANAICWGTAGGGGSAATPTVAGIVLGCTTVTYSALGCNALVSNTTGSGNVAIGVCALFSNTTGTSNTASGFRSLCSNTSGGGNTANGSSALRYNISGCCNTANGVSALLCNTTGDANTASGREALYFNTTGCCNVAIGCGALNGNITGSFNTTSGTRALFNNTSGCGNVMVGGMNSAGTYAPVFDPTTENDRVMIGSTATTNAYVQVPWTVVSDARDKIVEGSVPHGLEFVSQLEPKAFRFKEERESEVPHGPLRYGFLAQDILALEGGEGVIIDAETPEKLLYNGEALVPVLVNAIKELSAKVEALEAKLASNG